MALLAKLHVERNYLPSVLSPSDFVANLSLAFQGWSRFSASNLYLPSIRSLAFSIFERKHGETLPLVAVELLGHVMHRLPHPVALELLSFALQAHGQPHATKDPLEGRVRRLLFLVFSNSFRSLKA